VSVDVRVILLVEQDYVHDGYKCTNEKIDSHITKIGQAFWRSVPF
jgi:hypothetical protein